MNIVWASSESVPYAKTGGLADVSSALPKALAERGHSIHVIMPYYPQQMAHLNLKFNSVHEMLGVPFGAGNEWAQIRLLKVRKNLTYCFIEFNRFYDRATLYDWNGSEYADNAQRFIFFSRAVMQTILALKLKPDILHLNDWHCALCAVYLRSSLYSGFANFKNCRSVMTIHNIGYQGNYDQGNLYWTGLGWEYFNFRCLEFYNRLNLLKGGIMCADMVSTVSPTYAVEILSPDYGFALDPSLRHRAYQRRLCGILNGIDVKEWDPETDKLIPATFSAEITNDVFLPPKPDASIAAFIPFGGYGLFALKFKEQLRSAQFHLALVAKRPPLPPPVRCLLKAMSKDELLLSPGGVWRVSR